MPQLRFACAVALFLPLPALAVDRGGRSFDSALPWLAFESNQAHGLAALDQERYDIAIACFNARLKENPRDAFCLYSRGHAYLGKKQYDRAIADFTESLRIRPDVPACYTSRGNAHALKGDFEKALADHNEAIRLAPKDARVYFARGLTYRKKNDLDRAGADYTEAIRLDPRMTTAYLNRASVALRTKDYWQAIADYQQVILLEPTDHNGYSGLAWVLATCPQDELRDGKKAVQLGIKACELSAWRDANDLENLAAAHAECGNFKEAVMWQKKALEVGYENPQRNDDARMRLQLYESGKPCRE
jgi:tetratricopeptide (TPR) repeat protein